MTQRNTARRLSLTGDGASQAAFAGGDDESEPFVATWGSGELQLGDVSGPHEATLWRLSCEKQIVAFTERAKKR